MRMGRAKGDGEYKKSFLRNFNVQKRTDIRRKLEVILKKGVILNKDDITVCLHVSGSDPLETKTQTHCLRKRENPVAKVEVRPRA